MNVGQEFEIISDTYEISTATSSLQKEKSIVNVSSHPVIGQLPEVVSNLNKLNIIKLSGQIQMSMMAHLKITCF